MPGISVRFPSVYTPFWTGAMFMAAAAWRVKEGVQIPCKRGNDEPPVNENGRQEEQGEKSDGSCA